MLRIAVVASYFPTSAQPWQGRSAYQILRLLSRRAAVKVFYPYADYPAFLEPHNRGNSRFEASPSALDVEVVYIPFPALPIISRPFNGLLAAHAVFPQVRSFAPDLIFSFFLYPDGYAALKTGQKLSVPVTAMSIGSDLNRMPDPIYSHHVQTLLKGLDFLFTVSDELRNKALSLGASQDKTRTILNGCDRSVFFVRNKHEARRELRIEGTAKVILYVGRMDKKKGLRELVSAVSKLREGGLNAQAYLVGDGPDRLSVQRLILSAKASGYIHLKRPCAFEEVPKWMAAADVVTLPSYMEGCPNTVLEAVNCGRPVVATNVGGIPELLSSECGKLVPPRDPVALANALRHVLQANWDSEAISESMRRGWDLVTEDLLETFESLASSRKLQLSAHSGEVGHRFR